jgi:hypothetical protein
MGIIYPGKYIAFLDIIKLALKLEQFMCQDGLCGGFMKGPMDINNFLSPILGI